MKIFLDENIPDALVKILTTHQVESVKSKGWLGKKNGELIGLIAFNGFEVFVTRDRNLKHQQNLQKFELIIVVLVSKTRSDSDLEELYLKLKDFLNTKISKGVYEIS